MVSVLVTGGAGFIGSNFVRYALQAHPDWRVTNLDKLTYAGRRENLHDVMTNPRHTFVHGDILDAKVAGPLVEAADYVVHFAAETHVDRSIDDASPFVRANAGTQGCRLQRCSTWPLDSRFRGNERSVWRVLTEQIPCHSTVIVAVSVCEKPLSPVHLNTIVPLAVATVENEMNGLAAIAGKRSARNISSPL